MVELSTVSKILVHNVPIIIKSTTSRIPDHWIALKELDLPCESIKCR
jgi:hypothetical protein